MKVYNNNASKEQKKRKEKDALNRMYAQRRAA